MVRRSRYPRRRLARRRRLHEASVCRPGRADLLVLEAGADGTHGLAVELKVGGNGLLDSQVAWLARAQLKGWRTEVVRSLDEFCKVRAHVGVSACDPVVAY